MMNEMVKKGRRIGYARVSTPQQRLDLQLAALENAGCDAVFVDKGVSGKIFPRKGLSKALRAVGRGDCLVVYKLDRLGRSTLHLSKLLHSLEAKGVAFHSISQSMDISTASGKLIYTIFAAFAEFESNLNGERTKSGMKASKSLGVHVGRPTKLSHEDIVVAREMLRAEETSLKLVAQNFNVSESTIKRSVKRLGNLAA